MACLSFRTSPTTSGQPRTDRPAPASPAAGTRYAVPLLLARGMRPDSVLDDDDERELLRRLPSAQVIHVEKPATA